MPNENLNQVTVSRGIVVGQDQRADGTPFGNEWFFAVTVNGQKGAYNVSASLDRTEEDLRDFVEGYFSEGDPGEKGLEGISEPVTFPMATTKAMTRARTMV